MRGVFFGLLVLALSFSFASSVMAQDSKPSAQAPAETPAPPPPAPSTPIAPDNTILTFLKANPDCSEITDECIICAVVGGKAMCSTPGIACVRKDVRCVTTTPPTPKQ